MMSRGERWLPKDDAILRSSRTIAIAIAKIPHRTRSAIIIRRSALRLPKIDRCLSLDEAFWSRVRVEKNGCWTWTGPTIGSSSGKQYGRISYLGESKPASVFSWELKNNKKIPRGLYGCHSCDNTICVNPDHIFPGTAQENQDDARAKGRLAFGLKNGAYTKPHRIRRGEDNGGARLTEAKVKNIKKLFSTGKLSRAVIGLKFSVSRVTIGKIVSGKAWAHVAAMVVAIVLGGCSHVPRATEGGHLKSMWSQISDKDFIRVRGIGVPPARISGSTARRGASRNSSLVSARYQLLSVIKGVKLEGGITMAQLMEKDSLIREIADEVVSGGDEVKTEWMADDGCVVTLELKRSKVERLINEKSKREKGLEKRIAQDIAEINRLNREIIKIGKSQVKAFWEIDDVTQLDRSMKAVSKAVDEAKTNEELIMAGSSMMQLLKQFQDQEDAGLRR